MNKCGGCGKFLSGGVGCTKCKVMFHKQCVNLTSNQMPKQWLCPGCVAGVPRKDNTNTPVKVMCETEIESPLIDDSNQNDLVLQELRALRADMNTFRKDFGLFRDEVRDELKDLRTMYQDCTCKIDKISSRMDNYEVRLDLLESSCKENRDLRQEVYLLKQELNDKDQLSLRNDLEINGITEQDGENIQHLIGILTTKIGVNLDERDIVEVHRVGPQRVGQDGKARARPIVLRVARRVVRDQVLRAARVRRSITTASLELTGASHRVYINERLTKENRVLYSKTRALCKQYKWKFAWTQEGKIFIREADGKAAFRIRTEKDLGRLSQ